VIYIVNPGDTLALIAHRFGVELSELVEANGLADPDLIFPGQRLVIPSKLHPVGEGIFLGPYPLVQGEAAVVLVRPCDRGLPKGDFAGQQLRFVREPGGCIAFIGVYALAKPGLYRLEVRLPQGPARTAMIEIVAGHYGVEYIRLAPAQRSLLRPELILKEREIVGRAFSRFAPRPRWFAPFSRPLRGQFRVTSPFGTRRSYNGAPPRGFHAGVDFKAPEGTPLYAPAPGQVVLARKLTIRGNAVIIDHGAGVMSGFWHLSKIAVEEGQEVQRGELIGWVGSTGLSTGPHLHWEVRVNGVAVNPLPWLDRDLRYERATPTPPLKRVRGPCEGF